MRFKREMLLKKWTGAIGNMVANPAQLLLAMPAFLILVAITILSFETVDLFYKMIRFSAVNQSGAVNKPFSSRVIAESASRSSLQNYSVIAERNLFLSTLKEISDKQTAGGFSSPSLEAAAFDLKGTVAGGNSFGFIIMEERGMNKQRLYRLGDMIGSARLVKISRNTAIIKNGNRKTTLKIKETLDGPLLSPSQTPQANMPNAGMALSRSEVNEKISDLKTMMNQAAVRPYFEGGAQEGFIISDIRPDSLYQKLGLQNGDIMIDANGKRMQSADDILQMANIMKAGGSVALRLKRNGKAETINYSFY